MKDNIQADFKHTLFIDTNQSLYLLRIDSENKYYRNELDAERI